MFPVKDVNLDTITDAQSWRKTWQLIGFNRIRAKQKTSQETEKRACKKSWQRRGNQKSFTLTISWSLAKLVKIFRGIKVRRPLTVQKQMGLLREQYADSKEHLQYCCNQVWTKNGGLILWNAVAICDMFKTSWQTGKHRMKGDLENHLKDQCFRLAPW